MHARAGLSLLQAIGLETLQFGFFCSTCLSEVVFWLEVHAGAIACTHHCEIHAATIVREEAIYEETSGRYIGLLKDALAYVAALPACRILFLLRSAKKFLLGAFCRHVLWGL